ncbi:MAG TPA: molybdate ABC transporter substrate-binding protein [Novosphingobium sp.]|nr:molybdate ABC transporter substrate-binding protein [Novosphingobium sp.]
MERLVSLLVSLFLLIAAPIVHAAPANGPLVLAAASLQEAMNAAAHAWATKGHDRPRISFAGSSALARQIEAGAAADIFVSADEEWMDDVEKKGLLRSGTRVSFLRNVLVLAAPRDSRMKLAIRPGFPLSQALGSGRLAIADPKGVPAGIYAKQALTRLGVWNSVAGKLAPAENVRAALALVSRGAVPLGIVYATDVQADPRVRAVGTFPPTTHDPISYPVAVLKASRNPDAENFRRFLISGEGTAIFRRFGFGTL